MHLSFNNQVALCYTDLIYNSQYKNNYTKTLNDSHHRHDSYIAQA